LNFCTNIEIRGDQVGREQDGGAGRHEVTGKGGCIHEGVRKEGFSIEGRESQEG
jgi:hypothetical protein